MKEKKNTNNQNQGHDFGHEKWSFIPFCRPKKIREDS